MAKRRMISVDIIETEDFIELSDSAKALYLYLVVKADDYGFIPNHKTIARMISVSAETIKELTNKNFVIHFDTDVCVIKHWLCQNKVQPTKRKDTRYLYEYSLLKECPLKEYEYVLENECQQCVGKMSANCQHSIVKDSIGEDSIGEENTEKFSAVKESEPTNEELMRKFGYA